jgi:hypothetical protein
MRINVLYIIIGVLVIVNLYLLMSSTELNTKNYPDDGDNLKVGQLIEISRTIDEINTVNKNCIIIDKNGNELKISDLITTTSLILKISKLNCNTCTSQNIDLLQKFCDKHNFSEDKVIIIYQDSNIRDVVLLQRSLKNKIPIYRIKETNDLQLDIDKLNIPYFFLLDSNFQPNLIHVTNKQFPEFTEKYFEIIYERIFRKKIYSK